MTEQGQQIDDWGSTDVDLERVHDFEIEAMDVRLQTMGPLADWPLGPEKAGINARKRTREENTKTCLQCDRSNLVPKVDGWDSKHGFYCTDCWQQWHEDVPTVTLPVPKRAKQSLARIQFQHKRFECRMQDTRGTDPDIGTS